MKKKRRKEEEKRRKKLRIKKISSVFKTLDLEMRYVFSSSLNPILDTRISAHQPSCFFIKLRVPPLDSGMGWTGELW